MEKWTRIEDVVPSENGDIPASYVRLQEDGWMLLWCFGKLDGTPVFKVVLYSYFLRCFYQDSKDFGVASRWMHVKLKPKSQVVSAVFTYPLNAIVVRSVSHCPPKRPLHQSQAPICSPTPFCCSSGSVPVYLVVVFGRLMVRSCCWSAVWPGYLRQTCEGGYLYNEDIVKLNGGKPCKFQRKNFIFFLERYLVWWWLLCGRRSHTNDLQWPPMEHLWRASGTVDVIDPAPVDNVVTACLSNYLQLVVSKILYDHHQFDELMCLNCPKLPSLFVCEIPVREESVGAMVWDWINSSHTKVLVEHLCTSWVELSWVELSWVVMFATFWWCHWQELRHVEKN